MNSKGRVFIVDDDEAVRESLAALLEAYEFDATAFPSARDFLAQCERGASGCLLADVRMPDMDGLELQERVAIEFPGLAVVIMTGHGDVPIAVRAMKAGAVDFVEKPFAEDRIIDTVRNATARVMDQQRQSADTAEIEARLALLTAREREVLDGLIAGLPNKTIGYDLGISPRTVEVHRARVMDKMQARSLSDLVRLALSVGLSPK
ncbi:MAG TPA: response regulator FixJ [Aliidongia sp.]|nr:response regulator FixJ [Aliidongia sp.]